MQEQKEKQVEVKTQQAAAGTVKCEHCGFGYIYKCSPLVKYMASTNARGKVTSKKYICRDCLHQAVNR